MVLNGAELHHVTASLVIFLLSDSVDIAINMS